MMNVEEIRKIAEEALPVTLGEGKITQILVKDGFDHDGEPALFIDAFLPLETPIISGATVNSALSSLRSTLIERGEFRFPYLRLKHPDDLYPNDNFTTDRVSEKSASR